MITEEALVICKIFVPEESVRQIKLRLLRPVVILIQLFAVIIFFGRADFSICRADRDFGDCEKCQAP